MTSQQWHELLVVLRFANVPLGCVAWGLLSFHLRIIWSSHTPYSRHLWPARCAVTLLAGFCGVSAYGSMQNAIDGNRPTPATALITVLAAGSLAFGVIWILRDRKRAT